MTEPRKVRHDFLTQDGKPLTGTVVGTTHEVRLTGDREPLSFVMVDGYGKTMLFPDRSLIEVQENE